MRAHLPGTADQIRQLVPAVADAYAFTRDHVLRAGIVERSTKDLCFAYLASGKVEAPTDGRTDRERAALEWARAIAWDSSLADDAFWIRLQALFTEPELVELSCAVGFELGYQHWRGTIGLPPRDS